MKTVITSILACALVGVLVVPASAQTHKRDGYSKLKKQYRYARPRSDEGLSRSDYYEHLADKLPVGSSRWFEQMEREGRFGRRESP